MLTLCLLQRYDTQKGGLIQPLDRGPVQGAQKQGIEFEQGKELEQGEEQEQEQDLGKEQEQDLGKEKGLEQEQRKKQEQRKEQEEGKEKVQEQEQRKEQEREQGLDEDNQKSPEAAKNFSKEQEHEQLSDKVKDVEELRERHTKELKDELNVYEKKEIIDETKKASTSLQNICNSSEDKGESSKGLETTLDDEKYSNVDLKEDIKSKNGTSTCEAKDDKDESAKNMENLNNEAILLVERLFAKLDSEEVFDVKIEKSEKNTEDATYETLKKNNPVNKSDKNTEKKKKKKVSGNKFLFISSKDLKVSKAKANLTLLKEVLRRRGTDPESGGKLTSDLCKRILHQNISFMVALRGKQEEGGSCYCSEEEQEKEELIKEVKIKGFLVPSRRNGLMSNDSRSSEAGTGEAAGAETGAGGVEVVGGAGGAGGAGVGRVPPESKDWEAFLLTLASEGGSTVQL